MISSRSVISKRGSFYLAVGKVCRGQERCDSEDGVDVDGVEVFSRLAVAFSSSERFKNDFFCLSSHRRG